MCTGGTEMSGFLAAEAELHFNATFAFFGGEFGDFDGIHYHNVRVMCFGGHSVGEGVIYLVRCFRVSSGYVVSLFLLGWEGNSFFTPVVYCGGDGVHVHDAAHQGGRDSYREVSNQNIVITDIGEGDLVFESRNIFYEGG